MKKKEKYHVDQLFQKMNHYHKNIKLTKEINPSKFLDTRMDTKEDGIIIQKYTKRKPNGPFIGH